MKNHISITHSLPIYIVLIGMLGCGGCGGVKKVSKDDDIISSSDRTTTSPDDSDAIATKLDAKQLDSLYKAAQVKVSIKLQKFEDNVVDEYNVKKRILEFKNPNTGQVIKTIDLVKENPFHKMGFKRRKEPYPAHNYFLMKKGTENKHELKEYLPKEVFKEIPENFEFDRAISKIFLSTTAGKYATVSYELDWLPDAYSDQGEWDGPGYGVHIADVYDSLGNKIYTRQFDGTSVRPSISEDGKYLFSMACLSPEWDENIKYRFSVINIQTNKVVFEELIENCQNHGGGGDFYFESNLKYSCCFIEKANKTIKSYLYFENKFYAQKEYQLIDNWFLLPNKLIRVAYINKPEEIINIDSFFYEVKLDLL